MDDLLIIYLAPGDTVQWCRHGANTVQHGSLQNALDEAGHSDVVVVLPGESVLLTAAQLPPIRQASRRLQAMRYALEEQLASPVDTQHFALAAHRGPGETAVAVVADQYFQDRLSELDAIRAQIVAVVVDVLCIPIPVENAVSVQLLDDRAVVRHGRYQGFACELDLLRAMLTAAGLGEAQLNIVTEDHARQQAQIDALSTDGYRIQRATDTSEPVWLGQVSAQSGINLLQARYAPSSGMDDAWRPLRATAVLAGVWLVLALSTQGLNYFQLSQRNAQLDRQAKATFRKAFPKVQTINDIRVQAEQELKALRGGGGNSGIFPLLGATAIATSSAPGLQVQSLQYRDGALSLSLGGKDIQALEKLRASFAKQSDANLEVQSADAASDGVQIRARVTGAGA